MADCDLRFVWFPAEDDIPDADGEVLSESDRGDLWLVDNMDTTFNAPEGHEFIPAGNAWVSNRDEFNRLIAKARSDGLVVVVEES